MFRLRARGLAVAALALALIACGSDSPSDADDFEESLVVQLAATGLLGGAELDFVHEAGLTVLAVTSPNPPGAGTTCATNTQVGRVRSACTFEAGALASQVRWIVRVRVNGAIGGDPRSRVTVHCQAVDLQGVPVAATCAVAP